MAFLFVYKDLVSQNIGRLVFTQDGLDFIGWCSSEVSPTKTKLSYGTDSSDWILDDVKLVR